jgi:hypothetical protein
VNEVAAITMPHPAHLARKINDSVAKGDKVTQRANEYYVEAGNDLKALKAQMPKGMKWDDYLKYCGINFARSRADQLIRIAGGDTTIEEERAKDAERQAKSSKKIKDQLAVSHGESADQPEQSAEIMKAKFAALDKAEDEDTPAQAQDDDKTERAAPDDDQTKQPPRADVAKLVRAWVQASPEVRRQFVRERWDEIARIRKQLDANGSAEHDRWIEGDTL